MRARIEGVLFITAIEALHCILFTGILCLLGFFNHDNDLVVTFWQLVWNGGVAFWFNGYGAVLLVCLLIIFVRGLLEFFADRNALEARQKAMDKEILSAAKRLMDMQQPDLEASIRASCERELATRRQYLNAEETRLGVCQWDLDKDRQELETVKAGLHEAKDKFEAWKIELVALRRKAETDKERRGALKQRVRWAQNALQTEPANISLAVRHLKMAAKM